jgi:hypothetical protein
VLSALVLSVLEAELPVPVVDASDPHPAKHAAVILAVNNTLNAFFIKKYLLLHKKTSFL